MLAEGYVGSGLRADGSLQAFSFDKTGGLRTSPLLDESLRGDIFFGSVAVAGVDHQASFTTTAPFALYNPQGSDVDLVVLGVSYGYVSGTLGAGFLGLGQYVQSATNAAPTGTAIVARGSTKLGINEPKGRALETVTLTAGATLVFPVKDMAPKLATTALETGPSLIVLPFPIVVPPSVTAVLSGVCGAAGTSPRVTVGMIWREIKRLS